ncbi:MAG: CRTAC1 family protein [Planctomycetota bacterium]|jgi:hypothetical protein
MFRNVLLWFLAVSLTWRCSCIFAAITVSGTEVWAGGQMHGITPSGTGTQAAPYVYVIPAGIVMTSSGVIKTLEEYVTFDFSSGAAGLHMEAGSYFDLTGTGRLGNAGECGIILGDNNLTGEGDFKTVDITKDSKNVSITGTGAVSADSLYMHTRDAFAGDVLIDVGASVKIGSIDTQDEASGGNDGGNVTILGHDIVVGDIDTRSLRTASDTRSSGIVVLEARDYDGTNCFNNTIRLSGLINTDSAAGADGDITIAGVLVKLESGFDAATGGGSMDIFAGVIHPGMSADDLFIDNSGGGFTATHNVSWSDSLGFELPESGDLETVSPALIDVVLAPAQNQSVAVSYYTSSDTAIEGIDFVSRAGTLLFYPNQTRKTISVDVIDDGQAEDNEKFSVRLYSLVGQGVELARNLHTYTIIDPRPYVQFQSSTSTGMEHRTPAIIAVTLSRASSRIVTVDYKVTGGTASNGTDYNLSAGTLVFDPSQTSKSISIAIIDDEESEGLEAIEITLSGPNHAWLGDITQHTYTISDILFTPFSNPGTGDFGDGKAAWGDYNNDGWIDLLASGELWRNNSGSSFTQVANIGRGVFGDFNNDRYLDIYSYDSDKLFRNDEGTGFVEQPLPPLPTSISCGASWADFDNDGYLDIYVGGYETWEMPSYPDFILVNNRDGTFDVGWVQSDISGYANRARGVTSCDWDRDGDIDVYVSNYRLHPNILWRNDGSGVFNNVAPTHNAEAGTPHWGSFTGGHSIGAAWGDFDNDGLVDLFAGNFAHPEGVFAGMPRQPESRFLRNRGESADFQFEDLGPRGVYYQESYASPAAGDYDNDGDLDLYFTTVYATASYGIKNYPALFRNDGSWNFAAVTDTEGLGQLGPTYQAAFADFDNDGDLDLITDGRLFVNNGNSNNWLKLCLQGDGQSVNRAAIGAQVRIETGGQTLTRQVESSTGEGNQNELTLHFGLGGRGAPVDVQIDWPDGTRQTVFDVSVNQTVTIYGPGLKADFDGNCIVNNADLSALAGAWLQSGPIPQDLDGDGKVAMEDYAILAGEWLNPLSCFQD